PPRRSSEPGSKGALVRLNANTGSQTTAYLQANGGPVTQGANRTIRGTGRILGSWINNGLILADVSGATLQMDSGARTNNSIMQATGGGTLVLLNQRTTQGAGGRIVAQGGTVTLASCKTGSGAGRQ